MSERLNKRFIERTNLTLTPNPLTPPTMVCVVIYLTHFKPNSNPNPLFIDVSLESPCVADVPHVMYMYVADYIRKSVADCFQKVGADSCQCGWLFSQSGWRFRKVADVFSKRLTFLQSGWLYFSMWLTFFEWLTSFSKWLAVFEWLTSFENGGWPTLFERGWLLLKWLTFFSMWLTAFKVADFFSKRLTFFQCGWLFFNVADVYSKVADISRVADVFSKWLAFFEWLTSFENGGWLTLSSNVADCF